MLGKDEPRVGDVWMMKPPPLEGDTHDWPEPTMHVYPMKRSDSLLPNGILFSGGLDRIKAEQHDDKIIVEWVVDHWVVRRIPPRAAEATDTVSGQRGATLWRRAARRHQSQWRVNAGWPAGRQRVARTDPPEWRPIGSRVDRGFAKDTGCNFLGADILDAVTNRLRDRQDHQTLDEERLWCDLLSSMPMCFNLFGSLWNQPELAAAAVGRWFPDLVLPGSNVTIHFEWSPGRRDAQWLGDRTAFDAMIEIVNPKRRHLIGIETKYHEYPNAVTHRKGPPARYLEVTSNGGLFSEVTARELVWGQPVEQIWRDHLLALACGQHPKGWDSIHYVLLAPASNPAWVPLVEDYVSLLQPGARGSIEHRSLESLLDAAGDLLPHATAFRARYLEI